MHEIRCKMQVSFLLMLCTSCMLKHVYRLFEETNDNPSDNYKKYRVTRKNGHYLNLNNFLNN